MANSTQGALLTTGYRIAQQRLAAAAEHDLRLVWRLLDTSTSRWLTNAVAVVERRRLAQAALTTAYLRAHRAAEIPDAPALHILPIPSIDRRAIITSLVVTGPVALHRRVVAGVDRPQALHMSASGSAAAGARHVLNVGRDLTLATGAIDDRATGWDRVTSGTACDFCDEIASGGPFGFDADFPAHDHCGCFAELAYGAA